MSNNVRNLIEKNLTVLYALKAKGIKNINTAVDYVVIVNTYELFNHIPDNALRKSEVADRCRVSVRTVELALQLLNQETKV